VKRAAIVVALLALAGCAMPRPNRPPAPQPPAEEPAPPEAPAPESDDGAAAEVRGLLELGRVAEAEALLRERIRDEAGDPAALELMLARVLEDQGRAEEALIHFLFATTYGSQGGLAWDGVARLRRESGNEVGAARAALSAWSVAPFGERSRRTEAVRGELRRLSDADLAELVSGTRDLPGHDLALEERRGRREAAGEDAALRVVVLAPFSGRLANFGEAFRLGARIALEERAEERTDGQAVVLEWRDTEGDLLTATKAARHAVLDDEATAILGPLLSVTSIAAGAVAQSYGVPLIAPTATDPGLGTIGRYVVTLDPSPAALARPLAEFCVNELGARRFGVLLPSDGVSDQYEREFRAAADSAGAEVVVSVAFEPGETDFRKLIERIDREAVDAVYIPGSPADLEPLASQLDFYEFGRRVVGNGAWTSPRVMDPGNPALEGAVLAVEAAQNPDSDLQLSLRQRVRVLGGQEFSRFHLEGYRAMSALLGAIDRGARSGDEIVETLHLRRYWPLPPAAERVELLAYRDGVLGPAQWAPGFRLVPKTAPEEPDEDDSSSSGD
jgi:branched-chain amino acid transport system substrate-binding protein